MLIMGAVRGFPTHSGAYAFLARMACLACVLLLPLGGNANWTWLQALVVLLVAPLAEEVVFRLGLHESLLRRRVPPLVANLLVAAVFGLAHWVVRADSAALLVMIPALIIGLAFECQRRLAPCVCLHVLMNLVWFRLV
jgi:membrane protease YdiL (CAAX protease family)